MLSRLPCVCLLALAVTLINFERVYSQVQNGFPPTVHRCVWATNKLRKAGDGTTSSSCSNCDPALPACNAGCQDLIDTVYWSCSGVTLPQGYYFDPPNTLQGTWEDNLAAYKINVERCGCNAAFRSSAVNVFIGVLITGAATILLYL